MKIEIWDGEASRPQVAHLREAVYPPEVIATIIWREVVSAPPERRILLRDGDVVVATAGALWREAWLDGEVVLVGGIGGVMTEPALQRRGLGRRVVGAAADLLARQRSPAFGVLFCEEKNVGFYEKLGWSRFEGEVRVKQPSGPLRYDLMPTMVAPLCSGAPRGGVLDLAGLPW